MTPLTPKASRPSRTGLWLALVLLTSLGVYTPSLLNGFTFDDPHYARIRNPEGIPNPMVAELHPFTTYWQRTMNAGMPTNCRGFRPVTVYSYALINQASVAHDGAPPSALAPQDGSDVAWMQHLLNLLLHGAATLFVFLLVRQFAAPAPSLVAALVFGVHGIHSGPVAAIVGRAEMLAFVGGAGALLFYIQALQRRGPARAVLLAITGITALLAFGAKESAVAWAAFIPIFAWLRGFTPRRQIAPVLLSLGLPLALFLLLRSQVLAANFAERGPFWVDYNSNPLCYVSTLDRIASATPILLYALIQVLWPSGLSCFYGDGVFPLLGPTDFRFLAAAAVLIALLVLGLRTRRRHPLLFLATVSFFGFTFITSNLLVPIEANYGDRLLYTAVLGPALAAAWITRRLQSDTGYHRLRPIAALLLLGIVAYHSTQSFNRSFAWRDNTTLIAASLANQPNSIGLQVDMGNMHLWNFDKPTALQHYRRAVEMAPESPHALRMLADHEEPEVAIELLQRALRSPQMVEATDGRRIHWALGQIYQGQGRTEDAWNAWWSTLRCNPWSEDIRLHLLRETCMAERWDQFRETLEGGLALRPHAPFFRAFQGVWQRHRGEHEAAIATLTATLPELREGSATAELWLVLADLLAQRATVNGQDPAGDLARARGIAARFADVDLGWPVAEAIRARLLAAPAPGGTGR